MLTADFDRALLCAHALHRAQVRKGTTIPYVSQLMTVAGLVLEHGGTETQAIAALLHDAAEDSGGEPRLAEIRTLFGDAMGDIVADCADAWVDPKPAWRPRKEAHLEALPEKPAASLLVLLADKVHSAEAIRGDHAAHGEALWARFAGGPEGTRWYDRALARVFADKTPGALADRLSRAVAGFA